MAIDDVNVRPGLIPKPDEPQNAPKIDITRGKNRKNKRQNASANKPNNTVTTNAVTQHSTSHVTPDPNTTGDLMDITTPEDLHATSHEPSADLANHVTTDLSSITLSDPGCNINSPHKLGTQSFNTDSLSDSSISSKSLPSSVPFCPTGPLYAYRDNSGSTISDDDDLNSNDSDYTDNGSSSDYDTDNPRPHPAPKHCPLRCYKKYRGPNNRYYRIQQAKLHNIIDPLQGDEHLAETKTPSRHSPLTSASQHQVTFDAHIKQKDIPEGTVNDEKSSFLNLLLHGTQGFLGTKWEKMKSDTVLVVKFDSYENMIKAVESHNTRHANFRLHPAKYYKAEGRYISSREFKLINVPADCNKEDITNAIRSCTKRSGFTIRKRDDSNTVYITFFSVDSIAIVKNIWAIPIKGTLCRFMPAYFVKKHIYERKRYTAKFTGFPLGFSAASFLEIIDGLHGKNAYRALTRSDLDDVTPVTNSSVSPFTDEILVEFESEVSLNLACTRNIWYKDCKIIGLPKEIAWEDRDQWLRPSPPHAQSPQKSFHPAVPEPAPEMVQSSLPSQEVSSHKQPVTTPRLRKARHKRRNRIIHRNTLTNLTHSSATGSNCIPLGNQRTTTPSDAATITVPPLQPAVTRMEEAQVC
jgi:hypothetical protein